VKNGARNYKSYKSEEMVPGYGGILVEYFV
jgi:hypothetical protein